MAKISISNEHQQAINNLQIKDVFLMSSSSEISADFEPKYVGAADQIGVQYKHVVDRSAVVSFSDEEDSVDLFRVYVELGAKWAYSSDEDGSDNEDEPLAKIEACYIAEYLMKDEISKEALEEFALKNASVHIWPYWREYLMNHAMRMNLPKTALPIVQFSVNNGD